MLKMSSKLFPLHTLKGLLRLFGHLMVLGLQEVVASKYMVLVVAKKEALLLDTAVADHHDVRICGLLFFKLRNIFATSGQLNNPSLCVMI